MSISMSLEISQDVPERALEVRVGAFGLWQGENGEEFWILSDRQAQPFEILAFCGEGPLHRRRHTPERGGRESIVLIVGMDRQHDGGPHRGREDWRDGKQQDPDGERNS